MRTCLLNGLLLAVFFLPILVVKTADPLANNALRVFIFFVLADIAAFVLFFAAAKRGQPVRITYALAAAFACIAILAALIPFSVDASLSLAGSRARMTGWLLYAHIIAYAAVYTLWFQGVARKDTVLGIPPILLMCAAQIAASFLVSLSAILEYFRIVRISPMGWIGGTIGNPSILSGYLLPSIFLCAFVALASPPRMLWLRVSAGVACLAGIIALVMTDTFSAFLGLAAGGILAVTVFAFSAARKAPWAPRAFTARRAGSARISRVVPALTLAFIIGGLLFFIVDRSRVPFEAFGPRLHVWKIALKGFLEHPLTGFGEETFPYIFDRYFDPALARFGLGETLFDKPHNAYLELLSENGLIGFFAFAAFFAAVGYSLARRWRTDPALAACGLGALGSYFVFNIFLFDTFFSLLALIPFLAIAFFISPPIAEMRITFLPRGTTARAAAKSDLAAVLNMGIATVLIGLLWFSGKALKAESEWIAATRTPLLQDLDSERLAKLRGVLSASTLWRDDYALTTLEALTPQVLRGYAKNIPEIDALLAAAYKSFADSSKPQIVRTQWLLARASVARGVLTGDAAFFEEARKRYQHAINANMHRQSALLEYALFEARMREYQSAVSLFRDALDADGARPVSQWIVSYAFLGRLVGENREDPASPVFLETLMYLARAGEVLEYRVPHAELHSVALAFAEIGDFTQAYRFASVAATREPTNEQYRMDAERFGAMVPP